MAVNRLLQVDLDVWSDGLAAAGAEVNLAPQWCSVLSWRATVLQTLALSPTYLCSDPEDLD